MKWGEPDFSGVILGGYLGILTLVWGGLTAGVGLWTRRFGLPDAPPAAGDPRVTICVPARNEAHQIGVCVAAALAQDHVNLEVIVVDDGSSDGTGEIATKAAAGDGRFRLLWGPSALPAGWAGKQWACARAAGLATGEILLFVDADVVLSADAVRRTVAVLRERNLGLLSLYGTWTLGSFWEKVAIPVIGWFIRGAVDLEAVNNPSRVEAFANGQFILVERSAYEAVGGHGAVRDTVLDDVRLAQTMKRRGQHISMFHAPGLFRVRLYRSLGEIVRGYTKNFYEGMDRRPLLALGALLFLLIGSGLPWMLLLLGALHPRWVEHVLGTPGLWIGWTTLVCLLPIGLRARLERVDGRAGGLAWTHPIGNLVLGVVLLRSVFSVRTEWKGRVFHDGKMGDGKVADGKARDGVEDGVGDGVEDGAKVPLPKPPSPSGRGPG